MPCEKVTVKGPKEQVKMTKFDVQAGRRVLYVDYEVANDTPEAEAEVEVTVTADVGKDGNNDVTKTFGHKLQASGPKSKKANRVQVNVPVDVATDVNACAKITNVKVV